MDVVQINSIHLVIQVESVIFLDHSMDYFLFAD